MMKLYFSILIAMVLPFLAHASPIRFVDEQYGISFPETIGPLAFDGINTNGNYQYAVTYSGKPSLSELEIMVVSNDKTFPAYLETIDSTYQDNSYPTYIIRSRHLGKTKPVQDLSNDQLVSKYSHKWDSTYLTISSDWEEFNGVNLYTYHYGATAPTAATQTNGKERVVRIQNKVRIGYDDCGFHGSPSPPEDLTKFHCVAVVRSTDATLIIKRKYMDKDTFELLHEDELSAIARLFSDQQTERISVNDDF